MMTRSSPLLALLVAAGCLAGCQTAAPPEQLLWLRTDGQRMSGDPALESRARADLAFCQRQAEAAGVGNVDITQGAISSAAASNPAYAASISAARACMGARGYALVPQSQAAATSAAYAAAAGRG
jgi:hypothetical protein